MAYVSDIFYKHPDAKPVGENARAVEEGADPAFHNDNLFDQNEGAGGRLIDEATGKPIDNSTVTGLESLSVVDVNRRRGSNDVLGPIPKSKEDREADAWLERKLKELGHTAQT